jgi:hypothetical protein
MLEAARECDVRPVYNKSVLQQRLYDVLAEFMPQLWRPHPRNDDRARAGAEVIVAEVGPAVEREAFQDAARRQHMSEFELQEDSSRERDEAIERQRQSRQPKRKLYPC